MDLSAARKELERKIAASNNPYEEQSVALGYVDGAEVCLMGWAERPSRLDVKDAPVHANPADSMQIVLEGGMEIYYPDEQTTVSMRPGLPRCPSREASFLRIGAKIPCAGCGRAQGLRCMIAGYRSRALCRGDSCGKRGLPGASQASMVRTDPDGRGLSSSLARWSRSGYCFHEQQVLHCDISLPPLLAYRPFIRILRPLPRRVPYALTANAIPNEIRLKSCQLPMFRVEDAISGTYEERRLTHIFCPPCSRVLFNKY